MKTMKTTLCKIARMQDCKTICTSGNNMAVCRNNMAVSGNNMPLSEAMKTLQNLTKKVAEIFV